MKILPDAIASVERRQRDDVNRFILLVVGVPAIGAALAALMFWMFLHANGVSLDPANWGQMGDYFGGILNPLLAFFSLLTLCYTLALQFLQSASTARYNAIQKFESMLFELIRMHRENLASVDLWSEEQKRETRGRDCFLAFLGWIRKNFDNEKEHKDLKSTLAEAYRIFYEDRRRKSEVGHYFRNLYHIFKFIDETPLLTEKGKKQYAKIVRAQLSAPEVALLFLNGLHPRGQNFNSYVRKYALLQDLEPSDLNFKGLNKDGMYEIYGEQAFQDQDLP